MFSETARLKILLYKNNSQPYKMRNAEGNKQ